jgi:branched-chain amino acid transport system substrate-binding protein
LRWRSTSSIKQAATKAVTAAAKLIDQEKVIALLGATGTGQTMAIRSEIEKAQIPNVSLAGGNAISDPVNKWVFQVPWPNGVVVPKALQYLKDKGIKSIALLYDSGGFGVDGQKVIEKEVSKYGMDLASSESYAPTDTDMTSQLTKIKGTDAGAVVVWGAGKAPAIIAKNMQQLDMKIPYVGSHGIARKEFIEGAGDSAEGVVFPAGKIIVPEAYGKGSEAFKLAEEYIKDYEQEFGEEPNGTFPAHAYDGIHIIFDALKRLDKLPDEVDPIELRDEIESTKNLVLTGGSFTFSKDNHYGTKPSDLIMIEVKDQKFAEAKE